MFTAIRVNEKWINKQSQPYLNICSMIHLGYNCSVIEDIDLEAIIKALQCMKWTVVKSLLQLVDLHHYSSVKPNSP